MSDKFLQVEKAGYRQALEVLDLTRARVRRAAKARQEAFATTL